MQINISTRHGHISEATREKITAKLEKLSRLFERLTAIELTVDLEHEEDPLMDLQRLGGAQARLRGHGPWRDADGFARQLHS